MNEKLITTELGFSIVECPVSIIKWPTFKGAKRPDNQHPAVVDAGAPKIIKLLTDWLKRYNETATEEDLLKSATKLIQNRDYDGYALAKVLENEGWSVDAELVAELEQVDVIMRYCVKEATIRWIKDNQMQPPVAIGDQVKTKVGWELVVGEVTSIDLETGHCTVKAKLKNGYEGNWVVLWETTLRS